MLDNKPAVGLSSILGTLGAIAGGVGAVYAAVNGNDFATATAAAGGVISAVATISSRTAQAVVMLRKGAHALGPYGVVVGTALDASSANTGAPWASLYVKTADGFRSVNSSAGVMTINNSFTTPDHPAVAAPVPNAPAATSGDPAPESERSAT